MGHNDAQSTVSLFLAGDVMLGRGVDQILPHPCDPGLHESWARSALDYVRLAERRNGPIPFPVAFEYPWGDGLAELSRRRPDARLVNLETAVTVSDQAEPKGINYRMNPANLPALTRAGIQACVLANNHVLDWGAQGLLETLRALREARIGTVGAGANREQAARPLVLDVGAKARVLVIAFGSTTSGIPSSWAASETRPGVNLLPEHPDLAVAQVKSSVRGLRKPRDVLVVSVHWGGNWGYRIPPAERTLAHRLIDEAGADIVFGHSSHHPKATECYHGKLILYGCGDLINDYEGISGHEVFRGDLSLMYFARLEAATGRLTALEMVPFRIRMMRLKRAGNSDAEWLLRKLRPGCRELGCDLESGPDGVLHLQFMAPEPDLGPG